MAEYDKWKCTPPDYYDGPVARCAECGLELYADEIAAEVDGLGAICEGCAERAMDKNEEF